ncbi:MAG: TIGR02186 family protein [Rickettsiales bacterium]|nr:TIGR02186 family protein [Rickettsiales bacterium]
MKQLLAFLIFLQIFIAPHAIAKPLVGATDLRGIEITSRFIGKNLLFFGARNDAGKIVLVIRGPKKDYIIRKKGKVAGIWVNQESIELNDVNSYYAIASSAPLDTIKNDFLVNELNIGLDNISFKPEYSASDPIYDIQPFINAFLEEKKKHQLYPESDEISQVGFMGDTLFRSNIWFPEHIERGVYTAEFYLFNDGQLTGIQSTPIEVKKTGFDAFVYDLAYSHPVLYGIIAILIALVSGWLASIIFHKR